MYLSASNSLSINNQPIIDNHFQTSTPTAKDFKMIENNLKMQDLVMDTLLDTILEPSFEDLSSHTTGLGINLDILV